MRVLLIYNATSRRCGNEQHGLQTAIALRRAGADVTVWDGTYETIYEKLQQNVPAYVPADLADYDVVHFNWHPASINHYNPEHFAGARFLSVRLIDLPPHSWCPVEDRADFLIAAEPYEKADLIVPNPVVDWVTDLPEPDNEFTVGVSGVRGDGYLDVLQACLDHPSWRYNARTPDDPWLSIDDEVRRLARSTVNVAWYHGSRGVAGAPSMLLASRRPLLINYSPMLRHLANFDQVLRTAAASPGAPLEQVERWWRTAGYLQTPEERAVDAAVAFSWSRAATRMLDAWQDAINKKDRSWGI